MRKLVLLFASLLLIGCDDSKKYTLQHAHVIGCAYCALTEPCSYGRVTVVLDDGKIFQLYEDSGFKCDIYLNSTYWDLKVEERVPSYGEYKIVGRKMVK